MTDQSQVSQEQKPSDKELNFRALEQRYQKQLDQAQARVAEAERIVQEINSRKQEVQEEEDYSEPYVDHKKLEKKFVKHSQSTQSEIQKAMETAKRQAKEELKQEMWLDNNSDFTEVMQNAEKLYMKDRQLAESILAMPESFERQKLVYQNIKALGLHKPEQKQSTIQEKIDSNRKSPYYQPSGVSTAPYSTVGDFSDVGQKNAYQKMQELKKQLRL